MTPRKYQIERCNKIAELYSKGIRRIVSQLVTGGGKTVEFSMLTSRWINKFSSNVLILVNREVLAKQTVNTLYKHFAIKSDLIMAGSKSSGHKQVKVSMVETGYNRIMKNADYFGKVGLLIVDEAHYGEFKKMYDKFPNALIIGVTATPKFSTKKDPMKNYFDEIVVGPAIQEIIDLGSLVPNETFTIKGINTKKFGQKNGEYDGKQMGVEYSNSKHVYNTVRAYEKLCNREKTIVFNCNIEHSKMVTQAFLDSGYNARHLDGTESKEKTENTLRWFANTPDAILCNIMKLTAGFDEPSIINVILNYSTLSLTKYLQSTGRGSRPYLSKYLFRIIDMGGNYELHGDWRQERDWYDIFHNPESVRETSGVAPIKNCAQCDAFIPAQAVVCNECGFIHERTVKYDTVRLEFTKVVNAINTMKILENTKGKNDWQAYFIMEGVAFTMLKNKMEGEEITPDIAAMAFDDFLPKIKEWRAMMPKKDGAGKVIYEEGVHLMGMPMTKNILNYARQSFNKKIEKYNKTILKTVEL
jgi:superfamily II DNA or RNA helicase